MNANHAATADSPQLRVVDSSLMMKVFYAFAALALLSLAISFGGRWLGRSIIKAGYTDDTSLHEIVIGNDVITVPANVIRFDRDRRDGIASRLDLYFRYPEMDGYSAAARDDFNAVGGRRTIIFASFEDRMMSRDMSGRFEPIYKNLVVQPGRSGPGGTTLYDFTEKSGYMNEVLAVAARPGKEPFVARCLSGLAAAQSLAPCERDIHVGNGLSLTYRFPQALLADWQRLDAALATRSESVV